MGMYWVFWCMVCVVWMLLVGKLLVICWWLLMYVGVRFIGYVIVMGFVWLD